MIQVIDNATNEEGDKMACKQELNEANAEIERLRTALVVLIESCSNPPFAPGVVEILEARAALGKGMPVECKNGHEWQSSATVSYCPECGEKGQ